MNWYETVGKAHLRNFFGLINQTIRHGKENGLQVKRIDLGDAIRIYRGESLVSEKSNKQSGRITLEVIKQIQELYLSGLTYRELAERFDISMSYVQNIVNDKRRRIK